MCKKLLIVALSYMLMFGVSLAVAEPMPLTIITEDWPPYNYEEEGVVKGFSVEVVQAIMKELNVNYPIELLPGARGEDMLNRDPHVMNFSLFRTTERENRYKWIGPLSSEAIYFYKKKGNPLTFSTIEDAKGVKSVASRHKGLVFSVLQKERFTNLDTSAYPSSIVKKVVYGRTDLGVGEPPLGLIYRLRQANLPIDSLEQTQVKLLEFPLYIACTKDIPDEVIQQWQGALEKIKTSGIYTKIYHKYLGK